MAECIHRSYSHFRHINIDLWVKSILKIVQKRPELDAKLVIDRIRFEMQSLSTEGIIGSILTRAEELLKVYIKEQEGGIE